METQQKQILRLALQKGLLRSKDLNSNGLSRSALARLVQKGRLIRVNRGIYRLVNSELSEHEALVEVAIKYPRGIICLLSALRVHEVTTQAPFEVWLGIDNKAQAPKTVYPPVRPVRFTKKYLTNNVETIKIDQVPIQITTLTRTIVDCFKFRNKIGLDVALEALNEAWRDKRFTMDELWICASEMRMANVMRPYLESLS